MTTLYLIRHSVRIPMKTIDEYNTSQNDIIKWEKICLSSLGEKRAEILCNKEELDNVNVIYTSNCVRTIQTGKYLIERLNLNFNIDDRLDERRVGKRNDGVVKNWQSLQYTDENYKTEGGESQVDVRNRMSECIDEILNKHAGKNIAAFSHGYAITFYLMKYCKLLHAEATPNGNVIELEFKGKVLINSPINAPQIVKLVFDDNKNPESIEFLNYDDLPFLNGV